MWWNGPKLCVAAAFIKRPRIYHWGNFYGRHPKTSTRQLTISLTHLFASRMMWSRATFHFFVRVVTSNCPRIHTRIFSRLIAYGADICSMSHGVYILKIHSCEAKSRSHQATSHCHQKVWSITQSCCQYVVDIFINITNSHVQGLQQEKRQRQKPGTKQWQQRWTSFLKYW